MNHLFVIIGVIVIIFVIAAFWAFPMYQEYKEISAELVEKETQFQNREKYFSELVSIEQRLESFEDELVKLNTALPDDSSLPSLYNLIQRLSSESGLILRQISAVEDATRALKDTTEVLDEVQTKTTAVSLNLEGSYEGLKTFLRRTQTAPRLLDIVSVGFISPSSELSFQFTVHLNAFSY